MHIMALCLMFPRHVTNLLLYYISVQSEPRSTHLIVKEWCIIMIIINNILYYYGAQLQCNNRVIYITHSDAFYIVRAHNIF